MLPTSTIKMMLLLTFMLLSIARPTEAFSIIEPQRNQKFRTTASSLSCICINCSKVTNCKAYYFVESKHSQPHMNQQPTFTPRDGSPTIHVNIRTNRKNENEIKRLWSEHVEETRKAEEKMTASLDRTNGATENKLIGEQKYDLSVKTTYEYDVVACEDFEEDFGVWVRNMPEEIKKTNPSFVPT